MVEQAYALAWKQAFHLEKSWKVHARAARERRRGSEGRAKKESSFFSHPPPPPPPFPHPRGSLARSFSARFALPNGELALRLFTASSNVYNGGGLKPSATAPGKFEGWHHIRTLWERLGTSLGFYDRQASCLTQNFRKGWCTCWVVCLFVSLFSKFPLPVVTVFRWVRVMTIRGHGGEKLFKCSDYSMFFHQRIISGTRI